MAFRRARRGAATDPACGLPGIMRSPGGRSMTARLLARLAAGLLRDRSRCGRCRPGAAGAA